MVFEPEDLEYQNTEPQPLTWIIIYLVNAVGQFLALFSTIGGGTIRTQSPLFKLEAISALMFPGGIARNLFFELPIFSPVNRILL